MKKINRILVSLILIGQLAPSIVLAEGIRESSQEEPTSESSVIKSEVVSEREKNATLQQTEESASNQAITEVIDLVQLKQKTREQAMMSFRDQHESVQLFINNYQGALRSLSDDLGVRKELLVAHLGLQTNWGKSEWSQANQLNPFYVVGTGEKTFSKKIRQWNTQSQSNEEVEQRFIVYPNLVNALSSQLNGFEQWSAGLTSELSAENLMTEVSTYAQWQNEDLAFEHELQEIIASDYFKQAETAVPEMLPEVTAETKTSQFDEVQVRKKVNREAIIVTNSGTHGLYNGIYRTEPNIQWLGSNRDRVGQVVTIIEEAQTNRSTYVKFIISGKEIGWMDKTAFFYYEEIMARQDLANKEAKIITTAGVHGLYTAPYNTSNSSRWIGNSAQYGNRVVTATEEVTTARATYVHFTMGGKGIGWMDKRAFNFDPYDKVISRKSLANSEAKIMTTTGTHGIYSDVYNTNGTARWLGSNKDASFANRLVILIEEVVTTRATYIKFKLTNKEIGWMDKRAFNDNPFDKIITQKTLPHTYAKVVTDTGTHGIYSGVYNTDSSVRWLASNKSYPNYLAVVTEEAVTGRATYLKFSIGGKEIGWMDKRGFNLSPFDKIISQKNINQLEAKINGTGTHGLYNGIYNTSETVRRIASNSDYRNQVARITAEAQTTRATYVKFSIGGKEIGWMDKQAFTYYDPILSQTKVSNLKRIITTSTGTHGLYNGIYNTSSTVRWTGSNHDYKGKAVVIVEEARTIKATYQKFSIGGQVIGWMDKRAFSNVMDVPIIKQMPELPTGCEIVSVTMMLNYAGKKVNKIAMANEMLRHSNPEYGFSGSPFLTSGQQPNYWCTIYPGALMGQVKKHMGSATNLTGTSIETLKQHLDNGKPVVVWVSNFYGFLTHAITLTGYDETGFYYNDCWSGQKNAKITFSYFSTCWTKQKKRAITY